MTAALRAERATERHYGRDLAALNDALGVRAPCADPASIGLPLASLSIVSDWTQHGHYDQMGVVQGTSMSVSAGGLVGRVPPGDHSDIIVRLRRWVVVISPNFNVPKAEWRTYLRGLVNT